MGKLLIGLIRRFSALCKYCYFEGFSFIKYDSSASSGAEVNEWTARDTISPHMIDIF